MVSTLGDGARHRVSQAARELAWISQRVAAARARWRAMTALRLIRVLDVLREHASALEPARALSSRPSRPLASRPFEKSRLVADDLGEDRSLLRPVEIGEDDALPLPEYQLALFDRYHDVVRQQRRA